MGIIKQPSELSVKNTLSILIYGQPGTGKTTLGCSADDAVLFDYDGGVSRINGAHAVPTLQVDSWEDTNTALQEIDQTGEYRTIVIDTIGKMLDYMSAYIIRQDSKLAQRDGSLSLKGYGVRKKMFLDFLHRLQLSGRSVVFIAHEREERRGDDIVKRPEIGGSSANDLIKELDLVGYLQMYGKDRVLSFNPSEYYYAKNTCGLPEQMKLPLLIDEKGGYSTNNFLTKITERYEEAQMERVATSTAYAELLETAKEVANEAKDVEGLNKAYNDLKGAEVIWDSKLQIWKILSKKAEALGATFNKVKNCYE